MSDTSQGSGWWMASDGKWYPPELWTGPPSQAPAGPAAQTSSPTSSGQPASQPAYPSQSGYPAQPVVSAQPTYPPQGQPAAGPPPYVGSAPPGYGGYGAASPHAPYGQPMQQKTNGLAIASLICGIGGFLFLIPAILGIIFGFIARSQIGKSNGQQKGSGMALAGIIVGFGWLALIVLSIALSAGNNDNNNGVVGLGILMGQLHLGGLFT